MPPGENDTPTVPNFAAPLFTATAVPSYVLPATAGCAVHEFVAFVTVSVPLTVLIW